MNQKRINERNKKMFVWSKNSETFRNGRFETLDDCIADARVNSEASAVYVGETEEPSVRLDGFGGDIVDTITDALYDEVGECCDSFSPSKDEIKELDEQIQEVVKKWLEKAGGFSCFKVVGVQMYSLETGLVVQ